MFFIGKINAIKCDLNFIEFYIRIDDNFKT